MRKLMGEANAQKVCEIVDQCRGKAKMPAPVVIVVVGLDTEKSDEMLNEIATKKQMQILDRADLAKEMGPSKPDEVDAEFSRRLNEMTLQRKSVIAKFNFGYNYIQRKVMVDAAKKGMRSTQIIFLKLPVTPVTGFMYHEQKCGEKFDSRKQQEILESLEYGRFDFSEEMNWVLEAKV